jgi:hypothetical protein
MRAIIAFTALGFLAYTFFVLAGPNYGKNKYRHFGHGDYQQRER